jgi:cyanophycinase
MHPLLLILALTGAQPEASPGPLVIAGGGPTVPEIAARALELAGGRDQADILIVPFASSQPDAGQPTRKMWLRAGVAREHVTILDLTDKAAALAAIKKANLIWISGGSQSRLMRILREGGVVEAIRARHRRGATVGGTSAGAAVMSLAMVTGKDSMDTIAADSSKMAEGLGLWPGVIVDEHYVRRRRFTRLLSAVLNHPDLVGIGIDESTAAVVTGRSFEVIGRSNIVVIDARKTATTRGRARDGEPGSAANVLVHVLKNGMRYDLDRGVPAAAAPAGGPTVEFAERDHRIDVRINDRLFTSYLYADDLPKPVLYPVHTPAGVLVSRGYPLRDVKGESQDHPHHAGIFFAYDRVNGNNFWLNTARAPHIQHVKVTEMKGGEGQGQMSAVLHWVGKDGTVLLEERRDMIFHAGPDAIAIDFHIDLVAQKDPVTFGDTKEGLLALRVADWMREPFEAKAGVVGISGTGTGKYLNAEGAEGEKGVWGKRSRWVCLQAAKEGKEVGVAMFDHPSSVNHPTYWHARGYGLFAANPLGQGAFEASHHPDQAKSLGLTLKPGQKAHFQYRVLVYDGRRTRAQLEEEYKDFVK